MTKRPMKVARALRLGVVEMALLLLGMLFTRREIWQLHAMNFTVSTWQEGLLIPLAAVDGAITGAFSSRSRHVQNEPAYKGLLRWGTPLFFILYVGCAALCERISVGIFPITMHYVVRTVGLIIVLAGMVLRLWAQVSTPDQLWAHAEPPAAATAPESASTEAVPAATTEQQPSSPPPETAVAPLFPSGPHRLLRHPDASGKLVSLIGLPLVFDAWLPLLALPGVVILLKWHIADQEAFRISQLGEPYLEYRKKTWNLIPYVY